MIRINLNLTQFIFIIILFGFNIFSYAKNSVLAPLQQIGYGQLLCSALTRDGNKLVIGSKDCNVYLWDTQTGKVIKTFKGHTDDVTGVAITSDGAEIVSCSIDSTIKLWDVQTGELIRTIHNDDPIGSVAVSSDDSCIVSGSNYTMVKLWKITTGELLRAYSITRLSKIFNVLFSPDGTKIAVGSEYLAFLFDINSSGIIDTLKNSRDDVKAMAFSPDGSKLLTGVAGEWHTPDDSIRMWDTKTGAALGTYPGATYSLTFTPDGSQFVSARSNAILTYDFQNGIVTSIDSAHSAQVVTLSYSADGSRLYSCSYDGTIKSWSTGPLTLKQTFYGHTNWLQQTPVFFPNDSTIVTGSGCGILLQYNAKSGVFSRHIQCPETNVNSFYYHLYQGKPAFLTTSSKFEHIRFWSMEDGSFIQEYINQYSSITENTGTIKFSPDGSMVLLAVPWSDRTNAKIYDFETGTYLRSLKGHTDHINDADFSHDGKLILTTSSTTNDSTVKIWNAESGQVLRTIKMRADRVGYSPVGSKFFTYAGREITLWSTSSLDSICSFTVAGREEIQSVGFSPGGVLTYLTTKDWKQVTLYTETADTITFEDDFRIKYSEFHVFSKDGSKVLIGSRNRSMQIFDISRNITNVKNKDASKDFFRKNSFKIYSNSLHITANFLLPEKFGELCIYNLNGKIVCQQGICPHKESIVKGDLPSAMSSGRYLFSLKQSGNVYNSYFNYYK